MSAPATRPSRVVVAVDPVSGRDFAVEIAGSLAAAATPELVGLFVENVRLLEHAQSRLAREIMLTGRERPLDRAVLERQIHAEALRARASFDAAASRLGLRHTFQVARGELIAETVRLAAEAEALVVNVAKEIHGEGPWLGAALRGLLEARLPLVLLAREGWLSGRSIAVLVDELATANVALDNAARLARRSGSPVAALATRRALDAGVTETLRERGLEVNDVVSLAACGAADIVQGARECRARLIVLPTPASTEELDLVDELLRRLPSALMLVHR